MLESDLRYHEFCTSMRHQSTRFVIARTGKPSNAGLWSFSKAVADTWRKGGVFSDLVEEFIAGTDSEVAALTAQLLEKLCKYAQCEHLRVSRTALMLTRFTFD